MRDMNDASAATPTRRVRGVRTTILPLCLLAAGIVAAWQIHVFVRSRGDKGAPPERLPRRGRLGTTLPAWPDDTPAELAMGPAGAAGLTVLDTDPLRLAPPKGAARQWAFRRELQGFREEHAAYDYGGTPGEASVHYADLLRSRGFSLVRDGRGTSDDPRRTLVFLKDRIRVTVSLRMSRQNAKMCRVAVTSMQWRRSAYATQPARD